MSAGNAKQLQRASGVQDYVRDYVRYYVRAKNYVQYYVRIVWIMAGRENGVQILVSAGTPALALAVASAAASTTGTAGHNPDIMWT